MSIRGWRGISTAGAAALGGGAPGGSSSGRLHCERLAGDYGVRERWREEGEKKGGRGYGCALIQPAGAISPTPSGEPKGDPRGK